MQATIQYIREELRTSHTEGEIRELTRQLLHALRGFTLTDIILRKDEILSPEDRQIIRVMVDRLKKQEPVQYVIGETEFFGLRIKLNPHVLIPRPETEELVQWVISEQQSEPGSVLDLCCGSGCIALALKKAFPSARVIASDLSPEALEMAIENSKANRLEISFIEADILRWSDFQGWKECELIISNPPYVTNGEKVKMVKNVLDYEPHLALFVPDEDPLIFYRAIGEFAGTWLRPGGWIYFEINEQFGDQISELLRHLGYTDIQVRRDFREKERMVRAKKL
jgi:release factor glutamine methyltransferase